MAKKPTPLPKFLRATRGFGAAEQGDVLKDEIIRGDFLKEENDTRELIGNGTLEEATDADYAAWNNRDDEPAVTVNVLPGK